MALFLLMDNQDQERPLPCPGQKLGRWGVLYLVLYLIYSIDWKNEMTLVFFLKLACEITVSFMEIYNENAYDLLDKKHLELPLD